MARTAIRHRKELSFDDVLRTFRDRFQESYDIEVIPIPKLAAQMNPRLAESIRGRFRIKKNSLVAVVVDFRQEEDKSYFRYLGQPPSAMAAVVVVGLLGLPSLFLYNSLMQEVTGFIERAEEFR